jgi:hypothetical protein
MQAWRTQAAVTKPKITLPHHHLPPKYLKKGVMVMQV